MEKASEFIDQADECRLMAAKTRNETLRVRLTELAQRWIELAEERERFLKARPATHT